MNEIKMLWAENKNPDARKIRENTGQHYEIPSGWTELSQKEFAQSAFFEEVPTFTEKRRLSDASDAEGEKYGSLVAQLFHYKDNQGVALVTRYDGCFDQDKKAEKVRFYRFGCHHNYVEIPFKEAVKRSIYHAGNHWKVEECSLCGHIYSADTSG